MSKVIDFYNYINQIAPFSLQEEWDNSGLLIGESNAEVKKVLVALDCTSELIDLAVKYDCQLVVTHHPIIFKGEKSLVDNNLSFKAAKNNIAFICAHTSFDCAEGGVNDILAKTIGLENIVKSFNGELRIGDIKTTTVSEFAKHIKKILNANVNFCCGDKKISKVAVCSGAGSDFVLQAKNMSADVLVTGEAKHHEFLDCIEMDFGLITAGHFETEIIAMKPLMEKLENEFINVEFILADQKSPINKI